MAASVLYVLLSRALDSQPVAGPAFDVASVKPYEHPNEVLLSSGDGEGAEISGDRLTDTGTLYDFVSNAYGIKLFQVSGGADWMHGLQGRYFKIDAKAPNKPLRPAEARLMYQRLLAERFQLRLHEEQRELPIYEMVIAPGGSKLRLFHGDPTATPESPKTGRMETAELAGDIAMWVDRPVIDRTGLKGIYEFSIAWMRPELDLHLHNNGSTDLGNASIFTELREQLGLRLIGRKAPYKILVIDHAAAPSPN